MGDSMLHYFSKVKDDWSAEKISQFMINLRNKNSAAYKDRVETIRLEVYLPCCIPCPLCCAVCAGVLETEIGKWESALENLQNSIKNNQAAVTKLTNEAKETIERLGQEVVSLIDW